MDTAPGAGPSPDIPRVETACVIAALPSRGMFVLGGRGQPYVAVALQHSTSGRPVGVNGSAPYMPGAIVAVLRTYTNSLDATAPTAVILGTCAMVKDVPDRTLYKRGEFNHRSGEHIGLSPSGKAIPLSPDPQFREEFPRGLPYDLTPGEWGEFNSMDGGFKLSDYMASVKASELCSLDMFHLDDKLRLSYGILERRGLLDEAQTAMVGMALSRVESEYSSVKEALGVVGSGAAIREVEAVPLDTLGKQRPMEDAVPQPSFQTLSGGLFDGRTESVFAPSKKDGVATASDKPAALSMSESLVDGRRSFMAASGVSMVKTTMIPAPRAASDMVGEPKAAFEPADPPWSDDKLMSMFGVDGYLAKERHRLNNSMPLARGYADKVSVPDADESVETLARLAGSDADKFKPDYELGLAGDSPYMDPPVSGEVPTGVDAKGARSRTTRVYGGSAGVHVFDNGDLTLFGSHGEELRMSGGNIYLTCPGDVFVLPGRDLVQMAPRNASVKAVKGHMEVHSGKMTTVASEGAAQVKARGAMVVEALGEPNIDPEAYADGSNGAPALNNACGGLMIRSNSQMVLQTGDLSIGDVEGSQGQSKVFVSSDKVGMAVDRVEASVRGNLSMVCQSGAAVSMGQGGMELRFNSLVMAGNSVGVHRSVATTAPFVDKEGNTGEVNLPNGDPHLFWSGQATVDGSVQARSVMAVNVTKGIDAADFEESMQYYREAYDGTSRPFHNLSTYGLQIKPVWSLFKGLSREAFKKMRAWWPTTEALGTSKFLLPISSWQRRLNGKGSKIGKPKDDEAGKPYPGKEAWDGGSSLAALEGDGSITKKGLEEYGSGI